MQNSYRAALPWSIFPAGVRVCGFLAILWGLAPSAIGQETVAALCQALTGGDEAARVAAINKLADMGADAKDAAGDLAAQLNDKSPSVRSHAAYALGMIGPPAASSAAALAKAVDDPDVHVRHEAVHALEMVRAEAKLAGPVFAKALEDPEPSVRIAALDALTDLGPQAVPILTTAVENPKTRYWAALALGEFGTEAKPAVDALSKALADERPDVRREVLIALARIGADAAPAAPTVTPLLNDKDQAVRNGAAYALGRMGPAAAASADALRAAMKTKDELLPSVGAYALARIEPRNKAARAEAVKLLTATLDDDNPRVQSAALKGLMELDVPPEQVAPHLTNCVGHCDAAIVHEVMDVLAASGEAATPALIAALGRPESRGRAAILLRGLGHKANAAVPELIAAIADEDPDVRREVVYALSEIITDKTPVDLKIVAALDDPDMSVRAAAAFALGRAGTAASGAQGKLRRELESPDPMVRVVSAWALVHVAPGDQQMAPSVIPVLMRGLKHENAMVRRGAADALGKLGKAARPAASGLQALAQDPDQTVRTAALAALERIGAIVIQPDSKPVPKR